MDRKKVEVNGFDLFTFRTGKIAVKSSYLKTRTAGGSPASTEGESPQTESRPMGHCSKGHTVVIYFGKERWVMSASLRARPG